MARIEALRAQAAQARRKATLGYGALLLLCIIVAAWINEVHPRALAAGIPRIGEYFALTVPKLEWAQLFAGPRTEGSLAFWFYRADEWGWLLLQTANMAAMATLAGTLGGFCLAFPAASNLAPRRWIYVAARRMAELCRTVPEIVYALIFVWAFGVGPLAGILAIAIHSVGALGKLFAEVVENADMRPVEGVTAAGGNWFETVRFAVLPQVAPNFLSYAILRFEINVRGASVIGFVGGGGIGQELYHVIAFNYYEEVSAIVAMIILCVATIDLVSEHLRHRLIGTARI
ncbi:MAG: phosphonate ABC transporter, permease protein PhnE [Alphaproteobacteria bacterium]|nr:phosphonate ABC transporter, permease protein PhnE [Alphaproteobacteria bacterium]